MKIEINEQIAKDVEAVKRALKVFRDSKRVAAVKAVISSGSTDIKLNLQRR